MRIEWIYGRLRPYLLRMRPVDIGDALADSVKAEDLTESQAKGIIKLLSNDRRHREHEYEKKT